MGFGDEIPKQVLGRQPYRPPCEASPQSKNQEAKRPLIPLTLLQTAAKRRWESEGHCPSGRAWGLELRARCAGFSVTEIGNRKERLRVREAGASAAGRGQRPYASFPDEAPSGRF